MQDSWQNYWEQDAQFVQVFTNDKGEKNQVLVKFWENELAKLVDGTTVVDLACGAASIFRDYQDAKRLDCIGIDISDAALTKLKQDLVFVQTVCSKTQDLSKHELQVDLVCSQFGYEYAGLDSIQEISTILKPKGKFVFLSHYADGQIDTSTLANLKGLNALVDGQFLEKAFAVAQAFKQDNASLVQKAVTAFQTIEPNIYQLAAEAPASHHAHLYEATKQLLSQFNNYEFSQIEQWFTNAITQVQQNKQRLDSMHEVCIDKEDLSKLSALCKESGLTLSDSKPFYLNDKEKPVAWELRGHKD